MLIAIDIDGTLTKEDNLETRNYKYDFEYQEYYKNCTPDLEAIKIVRKLYNSGVHRIIIWTARPERDREVTKNWLKKYRISYSELRMDKLKVDLYIDNNSKKIKDSKID